jgi:inner membrane protein
MPLPIAHSAAGLAGYLIFKKNEQSVNKRQELAFIGMCLFLANLPDLDFVPGFIIGDIGSFHHGPSHSFIISLALAFLFSVIGINWFKEISKSRIAAGFIISAFSHPILDYFSKDTSMPFGVPLFWPFKTNYYISPMHLFTDVQRNQDSIGNFFSSLLFNLNNIRGVLIESLFAGIILFAIIGIKSRSRPKVCLASFLISFLCALLYYNIQIQTAL